MPRYDVPAPGPETPHCTELLVRRSRFLAQCAHTPTPEAARSFVERIRRCHADATHNCWAYAAGMPGDTARVCSSDDGEPHGTAGRPMLQMLLHGGVGEICMVVTRWFGGIKLGTGGLVRAYQDSVRENLASLPVRACVRERCLTLTVPYPFLDSVRRMLPVFEARLENEEYAEQARLALRLPEDVEASFTRALADLSRGTARWQRDSLS